MKIMQTKSLFSALLLVLILPATAQDIQLHFPHFAGKQWDLLFLRAQSQDTVLSGIIPPDGRVLLRIPPARQGYRGMARWMLREGGGIDMILNNENFSVECLSDQPNDDNIIYTGSAENDFLRRNHREQEQLLQQHEAIRMLERAYAPGHPLYAAAAAEKKELARSWAAHRASLAASPLYAARFREIVDLTRGIGSELEQSEPDKAAEVDDYLSRRLPWEALYTSYHWSGVIYNWVQMHSLSIRSDAALLASARRIMARLPEAEMYTSFCEYMARYFVKEGKDSLLTALGPEIKASGKLLRSDGLLAQFAALQAGEQAPDLIFARLAATDEGYAVNILRSGELSDRYSLLLFYQSGCGPCESSLAELQGSYGLLREKGVRLLAISADTDRQVFEETAAGHPWPDKFCDEQGMAGVNFRRYGVVGTPTLFLLDEKGQIVLRTAAVQAVLSRL
jgi:thiol-disulfide isomerase/thioredoxin